LEELRIPKFRNPASWAFLFFFLLLHVI
jgi:hypothetical protein